MRISCTLSCCYVVTGWLLLASAVSAQPPATTAQTAGAQGKTPTIGSDVPVNADAAALADFKKRVDAYVALHHKVAKSVPPLKESNDPAEITRAQDGLAAAIRAARADARPGDIFTPEIRRVLRKVLRPELKGEDGRDAKTVLKDDAPTSFPLQVNVKYPDQATRPTVPAVVLANLPTLPKEVEFRIIKNHLLLVDTKAVVIVDFMPNAITE